MCTFLRSLSVRRVFTMAVMIQQMQMTSRSNCGTKAPRTKVERLSLVTWEMRKDVPIMKC